MKTMVKETADARGNHKEQLLDELVERAKPFVRASLAEWLEQILEPPAFSAPFARPLQLSFKDFVKLSGDEQREWRHRVLELEEQWLIEQLAKRRAEWILVVGGNIVKASSSLEKLPMKKEIYRIARKKGFAPFLYIKDILIEESENSSWSRISTDDYYPTIRFYLGKPEWQDSKIILSGKQIIADLDTGCSAVLVDEKVKARSFLIRLVHNWQKSPFCAINPARKALVGRELALRLLLNLLLKSDQKETEILK